MPEEMKPMWKGVRMGEDGLVDREGKKENTQVVGMRTVEALLLPAKAGYGSVLGWRTLKL